MYLLIKKVHVLSVVLSLLGFSLRGYWMLTGSALLRRRPVRMAPHVVDTVLLASGITLAVLASVSPIAQPWLMAKIVALIAYILVGTVALKRGRTRTIRTAAFVAALLLFGYMLAVAIRHSPWPFA